MRRNNIVRREPFKASRPLFDYVDVIVVGHCVFEEVLPVCGLEVMVVLEVGLFILIPGGWIKRVLLASQILLSFCCYLPGLSVEKGRSP